MSKSNYVAELPLTREIALSGSRVAVVPPKGCNNVSIRCSSEITFYESITSYVEDGITYGTGYPGTLMVFPIVQNKVFYLNGTGTVYLLFTGTREV